MEDTKTEVKKLEPPLWNKCPRCRMVTYSINYDFLCNRCVAVILTDFPDHESVPGILADLEARGLTPEDNPYYDSVK